MIFSHHANDQRLFKQLSMFESSRAPPSKSSQRAPLGMHQQHTLASIRDSLSSITYRVSEIQASLNRKIDRSECMGILDRKVNIGHLKGYFEELQDKIKEEHRQEQERNSKMQEISIQKINHLTQKIKNINDRVIKHQGKAPSKNRAGLNKEKQRIIKPQQLYLQTNQTMFSLIIDEISKLQEKNIEIQRQLENRNKKMINLNNQVCKKLQKLESEIEQKIHAKPLITEPAQGKYFGSSWSQMDRNNKPTIHKGSQMQGSTFQSLRFELITKNIEALQKQMLNKMNIKDILPIIRQNTLSFTDSSQQLREYVEQSVDSMRKILSSQTEINRELSLGIRCGWWHSFTQENDIAVINKQLVNLVPQIFELPSVKNYSNFINIAQQGIYLVKIYPLVQISNFLSDHSNLSEHQQEDFQIMIGSQVHVVGGQSVLRLEKNSEIRVILRSHCEIVLFLQKL